MASRDLQRVLRIRAADIVRAHTVLAFSAFLSALAVGCALHYRKIVKNGVAGYPQEWFPSVSATIGDWYPERNIFQILIALNSGPRFVLVLLNCYYQLSNQAPWAWALCGTGILRTLSCGGWVYVTSNDDHDAHDVLMISYIVLNIPWMLGNIASTPKAYRVQRRKRILLASLFFGLLPPMIYFFIRHKLHRIPGAYTHYAFFEWALIFLDILYDGVTETDFLGSDIQITVSMSGQKFPEHANEVAYAQKQVQNMKHATKVAAEKVDTLASTVFSDVVDKNPQISARVHDQARTHEVKNRRRLLSYISDAYLAFLFWSIYTSLIPSLFYFSVWKLGIAGAELALLSILSPGLLGISFVRNWASSHFGRTVLHVLSLSGLSAYRLSTPFQRLLCVVFANVIVCIGAVVDWKGLSDQSPEYHSVLTAIGLGLSSLAKQANHSNNPVWPMVNETSGGYNKTGIFLAILAICEFASRPSGETARQEEKINQSNTAIDRTSTLLSALPLGSLIYSLHCFMTDPSTLIAWNWTGYPVKGPVPHLHGTVTMCAMSLGILLSLTISRVALTSPSWHLFGSISSFVLYSYNDWTGFLGGVGLAVFLMSIIPQTICSAARTSQVGRVYFSAFFVTILLYLANVWTVAYAFVPGGKYLRERSDLVLIIEMLLLAPAFDWSGRHMVSESVKWKLTKNSRQYIYATIALIAAMSGLVSLYRTPVTHPQPFKPGPRIVRAGIWTVHFGMDNEGRDSQQAITTLVKDLELDIVGLLETDLHRTVYGNRDLTRVLQEEIGYYVDLGPGPNLHTWGAVLLSKFPIINSTHHLLPSPNGELAPAITAYLDIWGTEVLAVVVHNGQEEDPLDRELQSTELARILDATYPTPVIFLGYIVTKPHDTRPAPYRIIQEDGRVHDIEADDNERWCEYIFYRGLYRTAYVRVSRGKVTDTELQVGQFVLPRFGHNVTDESIDARYLHVHKEALDEHHWFPMEYYGNEGEGGKNGHYYHVFMTPLYYNIPDSAIL